MKWVGEIKLFCNLKNIKVTVKETDKWLDMMDWRRQFIYVHFDLITWAAGDRMYYLAYIRNQQEFFDSYHSGLTKFPTENKFSSFKPFGRLKDNPTCHCMSSIVAPVCLICDLMKSSGSEVCYETKRSKIWQMLNSFPIEAAVWETPSNQKNPNLWLCMYLKETTEITEDGAQ